jgi:hypothetical protein
VVDELVWMVNLGGGNGIPLPAYGGGLDHLRDQPVEVCLDARSIGIGREHLERFARLGHWADVPD